MNGIFKTRVRKQFVTGSQPVTVQRLITDNLVDDDGNLVSSVVRVEYIDSKDLEQLPDSKDYQLSDMLKQGFIPKEVPTHGLISDSDFNIGAAFRELVALAEQIKPVSVENVVSSSSSGEVVTEAPVE